MSYDVVMIVVSPTHKKVYVVGKGLDIAFGFQETNELEKIFFPAS